MPHDGKHGLTLEGCVVKTVEKRSPAERAGLKVGYTIERIDKVQMASAVECRKALRERRGKEMRIRVRTVPSAACPACGQDDSTEHLICKCSAYTAQRHSIFGVAYPPITVLGDSPAKVAKFLEATGRYSSARTQKTTGSANPGPEAPATAGAGPPAPKPAATKPAVVAKATRGANARKT